MICDGEQHQAKLDSTELRKVAVGEIPLNAADYLLGQQETRRHTKRRRMTNCMSVRRTIHAALR
jgi:hypothetical protein